MTPALQVTKAMVEEYKARCRSVQRGIFLLHGDSMIQAGIIFWAVAYVVGPMVFEVERLRREVAELTGDGR